MTPTEAAKALRDAVIVVAEHLEDLDKSVERKAGLDIMLNQVQKEFDAVTERLRLTRAELGKVEDTLKSKAHVLDDERLRAFKEAQDRIAAANDQLAKLNSTIADKQKIHDELLRSMEALRKRLLG